MATMKKSAKSAPKMTKPVAPAKKGIPAPPPMAANPMGGAGQGPQPMMKKGGKMTKAAAMKKYESSAEDKKADAKGVSKLMKTGKLKSGGMMKKYKDGGSFPDLNKDGKITKADILKGRGVIAKKGAKMKKK